MSQRYCPACGAEYRSGVTTCSDCGALLVEDESGGLRSAQEGAPELNPLKAVFVTGRRSEAEVIRSFLDAHSVGAHVWSSGLSPWRLEAALTEVTGVPNDFGSHRVMVPDSDADRAQQLLDDVPGERKKEAPPKAHMPPRRSSARRGMDVFRTRWALVGFALFLLMIVLLFGPPPP